MSDIENPAPVYGATRSPELNELATALAKAQMAMEGARKDKTNPHFKSAYADLAAVWDAVREPLASNGLSIMQWPRTVNGGVEIETVLLHSSGQFFRDTLFMPVASMNAHGIGSAITYGRRYSLMAVAGVASVDDDGNEASKQNFSNPKDFATDAVNEGLAKNTVSTYEVEKRKLAEKFVTETLEEFRAFDSLALSEWYDVHRTARTTNRDFVAKLEENYPDLHSKLEIAAEEIRLRREAVR